MHLSSTNLNVKISGDWRKSSLGFIYSRLNVVDAQSHLQIVDPSCWGWLDRHGI